MGIKGLIGALKCASISTHVSEFRGSTIGVDGLCWIHRGSYACATELALGRSTKKYLNFCRDMALLLLANGIKVIVVFDGNSFPIKARTKEGRRSRKAEQFELGKLYMSSGNMERANQAFQQCITVTAQMVAECANMFEELGVEVVHAPFEADAQLAYMFKLNQVDFCVTEDSDLLTFGAERIVCKLDKYSWNILCFYLIIY